MKTFVKSESETKAIVNQSEEVLPLLQDMEQQKQTSDFFKALGDETRLKIIGMLAIDDLCMCEIVSGLDAPSSTIAHHLKILERGNAIYSRKEGRYTIYQLNKDMVLPLLQ